MKVVCLMLNVVEVWWMQRTGCHRSTVEVYIRNRFRQFHSSRPYDKSAH